MIKKNKLIGITVGIIFLLLIIVPTINYVVQEHIANQPKNRVEEFITNMSTKNYDNAYYKLNFNKTSNLLDEFKEFAENTLTNAEYLFDEQTSILSIKTDFTTYQLQYTETDDDWSLQADDLLMNYTVRVLSLIYEETSGKNWNLGYIQEKNYIGDGILEIQLTNFKQKELNLYYCIATGGYYEGTAFESSRADVKAVLSMDEDGNISSLSGIYNNATSEELLGGISTNGELKDNIFTVKRYMFGENYLNTVAKLPIQVLMDMRDTLAETDDEPTFDEYQSRNSSTLANTEQLRTLYEEIVSTPQSLRKNSSTPTTFDIEEYTYNTFYTLGSEYKMTITANLYTNNLTKTSTTTFEAKFIPGEKDFIVNYIN